MKKLCNTEAEMKKACTKKLSFPLRISSVNVTKSLMENLTFFAVYLEKDNLATEC